MTADKTESERIESAYQGVFDRIKKATEEERGFVLWRLISEWCVGCGKPLPECLDHPENITDCCGVILQVVRAKRCPKCEMIHMNTVEVIEP